MHQSSQFCIILLPGIYIYDMCFILKCFVQFFDLPVNVVNGKSISKSIVPGNKTLLWKSIKFCHIKEA